MLRQGLCSKCPHQRLICSAWSRCDHCALHCHRESWYLASKQKQHVCPFTQLKLRVLAQLQLDNRKLQNCIMQMVQIELEQSEEYIKQLKEQPEQDQLRIDNKVCATVPASASESTSHLQAVAAVLTL